MGVREEPDQATMEDEHDVGDMWVRKEPDQRVRCAQKDVVREEPDEATCEACLSRIWIVREERFLPQEPDKAICEAATPQKEVVRKKPDQATK